MRVLEQRRARNRRQEVHTQALRRDHVHERVGAGGVRVVAALGDVLPHGLGLHVEGAQHAGVHHHAGRAVGAEEGASKLAVRGEEVVDVLLRRRRHRVAEADERAIAAALEESARHADARGGLLVLVGAGLLAGAAARGRARRLVTGVLGLLARWPNAGALSTFSSVVFRTLLRQPESEARLECVLTDPEVRAPRHAPPLPRAAPGRPLQGLTSWPTPWTAQQAACGSLARATSAVEHAFVLSGAARRAAPGSGRGCPLHRRGSRVSRLGRPWVCAAAADVYERRSTEC